LAHWDRRLCLNQANRREQGKDSRGTEPCRGSALHPGLAATQGKGIIDIMRHYQVLSRRAHRPAICT
jgi:hypothetical protein